MSRFQQNNSYSLPTHIDRRLVRERLLWERSICSKNHLQKYLPWKWKKVKINKNFSKKRQSNEKTRSSSKPFNLEIICMIRKLRSNLFFYYAVLLTDDSDPIKSSSSPRLLQLQLNKACKVREKLFSVHWIVIILSSRSARCAWNSSRRGLLCMSMFVFFHGIINNYDLEGENYTIEFALIVRKWWHRGNRFSVCTRSRHRRHGEINKPK